MTEEALTWIRDNKDKPMFLYLAYCIPHVWWQVPELGIYNKKNWPESYLNIQAAMVSRMDRDIGRIKKQIEELGIAKNTLIIFNSDNIIAVAPHIIFWLYLKQGTSTEFFEELMSLVKEILVSSKSFKGNSMQVPPFFSALKYKGKPLYKYARKREYIL